MGFHHVAGLDWPESPARALPECRLERMYKIHQIDRSAAADIEQAVPVRGLPRQPDHRFDDVVDISKVALHAPVVENVDCFTPDNRSGEFVGSHIRSSPRPIHGEKPESRHWNLEQMSVGMRHQLIGFFRRGVKRNRMVDRIINREGKLRVTSVDGARRCVQKMRDPRAGSLRGHLEIP